MIPPHIMRQLMTQHPPHFLVRSEPIIRVRPQPQLDRLSRVHVQSEQLGVLVRCELSQETDGETVLVHDVCDGWVVGEFLKKSVGRGWVWEVLEGLEVMEAVLEGGGRGW